MNLIALLSPYLLALILTLSIEGALCLLILKSKSWLKFTCLVNLLTNPLVNLLYALIYLRLAKYNLTEATPFILLLLELIVWLSETYLFYKFGAIHSSRQSNIRATNVSSICKTLLFSFVLNAASYGTGLLLQL